MKSINCKGNLVELDEPKIMGILNITPDSFFDGGKYTSLNELIAQTEKMLSEGATFIDVGAYSSRPGAKHISEEEELTRILPAIDALILEFPSLLISVDTFRSNVAKQCIKKGACMVNDISAGNMDSKMFTTIQQLQVPYIIMHMQGTPQTMQHNPTYGNIVHDLLYYFSQKIYELRNLGVNDIIADVGFGFGKTLDQNYQLLNNLDLFKQLEIPNLVGLSRKSMLFKLLDISQNNALNATTIANTIAIQKGASILRVHDVKQAKEAISIVTKLNSV